MELKIDEVLRDYQQYISNLPVGLEKLLENIEMENFENVNSQIVLFVEGLQWILSASTFLESKNVLINADFEQLNNNLEMLLEGFEKRDYVLMSDIIEYELIPYFENLKVEN